MINVENSEQKLTIHVYLRQHQAVYHFEIRLLTYPRTMPKTHAEINEMMERVAPELRSEYAKYPLARSAWLKPSEMGPNSAMGFIKADTKSFKEHYVYGRGHDGTGHNHILTRHAYIILTGRLQNSAPVGLCCFAESRKAADEHFEVKQICFNRSVSSIPDDVAAARAGLTESQAVASFENYNNY